MAEYQNTSGSAVNLPLLGHDVDAGEIVTIPDDVLAGVTMPDNIFTAVEE